MAAKKKKAAPKKTKAAPKKKAVVKKKAKKAAAKKSTRQIINPPGMRKRSVPLSDAVKLGNVVYVSGSTPYDNDGKLADSFDAQMHQVMANLIEILKAAGSTLDKVVKTVVFLSDMGDFAKMNAIYKTYFKEGNYPARSTMQTVLARPDFMLEIECVAEA